MALPLSHSTPAAGLNFLRWTFASAGDEWPVHDHTFDHTAIVLKGAVELFDGAGKSVQAVEGGGVILFPAGVRHGLRAVTAGAVVMNILPMQQAHA